MARLPRLVLPGYPYHFTQRGNRRQQTFFEDADFALYRDLLGESAARAGAEVWAYCLMPNHVHVVVVPHDPDGLRRTFADAHRRYTGFINARHRWTGHLWQGRFGGGGDGRGAFRAGGPLRFAQPPSARVRGGACGRLGMVERPRAHLAGRDDALVKVAPALERYGGLCQSKCTAR